MSGFDDIDYASLTDVGVRRQHNEDNYAILLASDAEKWRLEGHLFMVADGMGAHATGEKASELAASIIPHTYNKNAHLGPVAALRKAFIEANTSIHSIGQQNRDFEGMGTTGTALLLRPEGAWVAHVGDSRVYRIRQGTIEQLSFDHSLLWAYARQQHLDPERVQNIPSNVIVRSLGPEPLVQVDLEGPHPLQAGDIYLLCSDGLSGQLTDAELGAVVTALPPAEACRFLVDLANLRGGPDNITVLVIRVGEGLAGEGTSGRRGKSWLQSLPWPLAVLVLGTLLAAAATGLTLAHLTTLSVLVFLLAAGAIVAGLIGLALQYQHEKKQNGEEEERPPPKVYRHKDCNIQRPLLDKLSRAAQALKQRANDRHWEADWNEYEQHRQRAEKSLGQGDMVTAFCEYCRAMRPLSEAVQRHRTRDDPGPDAWPKAEN